MRQAGLSAVFEKKWRATTVRVPGVRVADDLLDRDFAAEAPNRCWVADITYLRTWEGWLYLVAVQDLYSRRIVGWSMPDHMRTELVTDALQMALAQRRPDPGLMIKFTDQQQAFPPNQPPVHRSGGTPDNARDRVGAHKWCSSHQKAPRPRSRRRPRSDSVERVPLSMQRSTRGPARRHEAPSPAPAAAADPPSAVHAPLGRRAGIRRD